MKKLKLNQSFISRNVDLIKAIIKSYLEGKGTEEDWNTFNTEEDI